MFFQLPLFSSDHVVVFLLNADVVDGNANFVLGTVFAVIIKYMKLDEEDAGSSDVKEALLLWAKNKTTGYKDVSVGNASSPPPKKKSEKIYIFVLTTPPKKDNFTKSFQDGLAFNALIHKLRPKLIPFDTLDKVNENA